MIFNSAAFLVFFVLFFHLFWWINKRFTLAFRNYFIVAASYLFYGWWDWRFLGLIVLSSFLDFYLGKYIHKTQLVKRRRNLLIMSVIVNLGILGFFKYFNFFIDSLSDALALFSIQVPMSTLEIILPVGISFYTFQTLSYTIDIYRRKLEPTPSISAFFAFVAFFPQLVAGPIERASHLLAQFNEKKYFNYLLCVEGLRLVLWGFFKKLVIADNFGVLVDHIFALDHPVSGLSTILGAIFFAIQIYADFSGYSDIAIGVSKMLGFDLMQNFRTPYFAQSFTEFWSRWHISLSTWFRDYVYIPLGGNRVSKLRGQFNIIITFLLSGLWHGANITFLIWGGLHGLVLLIDKRISKHLTKTIYGFVVMTMVFLLWLPFRTQNTAQLFSMVGALANWERPALDILKEVLGQFPYLRFYALLAITTLFMWIESKFKEQTFSEWLANFSKSKRWLTYYMLILVIFILGSFDVKPNFIYFQF